MISLVLNSTGKDRKKVKLFYSRKDILLRIQYRYKFCNYSVATKSHKECMFIGLNEKLAQYLHCPKTRNNSTIWKKIQSID
jgi:hypothetical protein